MCAETKWRLANLADKACVEVILNHFDQLRFGFGQIFLDMNGQECVNEMICLY